MRTLNLFFTGLWIVSLFSSSLQAQSPSENSVDWQRLRLERELESKLRTSLVPILNENQYVLSVQVALGEDLASSGKDGEAFSADAVNSDLPLSKLGFWAPLLRDTLQGETDSGRMPASMGAGGGIFSKISQIDIKLILDESVAETKKTLAEEIINRGVAGVSRVQPIVAVVTGDLKAEPKSVARSWSDWVLEFKDGISILFASVLAILLLSFFGMMIAKDFSSLFRKGLETFDGYISFKKENGTKSESSDSGFGAFEEPVASQGTVVRQGPAGGGTVVARAPFGSGTVVAPVAALGGAGDFSRDGFEKFRELHEKAPDLSRGLIKKWVNSRSANDAKALMVIGQRATVEQLNDLFGSLSPELKQQCKRLLALPVGQDSEAEGLDYIQRQVMEQYVSARPSLPEKTLALIDSVTEKEFLEITEADYELGAMLLSALPTAKVSVLLTAMSTELFSAVSDKTANIFDKDISSEAARIESTIRATRDRQVKRSAFLDKSMELIPTATPDKEVILYKMLIQAGDLELVRETALKTLPSSLVTQVPGEVVQKILTRMNPTDRAELIASQDQERSSFLLSCLGQSGDKLRELVESEVQEVQSDASRTEALKEDAESLWGSLVLTLRNLQRQNPVFARSLKPIVNRWVRELAEGQGSSLSEAA